MLADLSGNGDCARLLPARVTDVDVPPLLNHIVYIDLVGLPEDEARERLLTAVRARRRPDLHVLRGSVQRRNHLARVGLG